MKKIFIYISIIAVLSLPVYISRDKITLLIAEARCGSFCNASKAANKIWGKFTGSNPGGGTVGISPDGTQPFGGVVSGILFCNGNGVTAFFQAPAAGVPGPYGVSPASLRSYGAVYPGNNIVGSSVPGGVCLIIVGGYVFAFPLVQTVTLYPGMGTSLVPGRLPV